MDQQKGIESLREEKILWAFGSIWGSSKLAAGLDCVFEIWWGISDDGYPLQGLRYFFVEWNDISYRPTTPNTKNDCSKTPRPLPSNFGGTGSSPKKWEKLKKNVLWTTLNNQYPTTTL